jgi:hypothetical protein
MNVSVAPVAVKNDGCDAAKALEVAIVPKIMTIIIVVKIGFVIRITMHSP